MKTIAQTLKEWLDSDNTISNPTGKFTGNDFNKILKVINGQLDNFTIFYNGGGNAFDIFIYNEKDWGNIDNFKKWIESDKQYHFMYKINLEEFILRPLTKN